MSVGSLRTAWPAVEADRPEAPDRPEVGVLVARLVVLAVGVVGALLRPWRLPAWVVPAAAVAVEIASGLSGVGLAVHALGGLSGALGFLLAAVPLSVLLDQLGLFEHLARLVSGGRHVALGLWVVAAGVTAILNLDASVVLLTPLFVRVARRLGLSPLSIAFQPALLACLASSPLPVSNLTNLILASRLEVGATAFLVHLGPATLGTVGVGYLAWRRALPPGEAAATVPEPVDRRILGIGLAIVTAVLVGFLFGSRIGLEPDEVALAADIVLVLLLRTIPWRSVPVGTAAVAGSLGILATAVARSLDVASVLKGVGLIGALRAVGLGVLGADVANNLPAVLVAGPALSHHGSSVLWGLLLGVNVGPAFVLTGALAGLLWADTVRRQGVAVSPATYSRVGVAVGFPALIVGAAVLLGTLAVVGSR